MTTTPGLWSAGFGEVGATLKALEDRGVTLEHLKQIRSTPAIADAVASALLGQSTPATAPSTTTAVTTFQYTLSNPYRVSVPHGKRAIKELATAGAYDYVNSDITDKHFPNVREADDEFDILLAHFNHEMQSDDVERLLRADGLEVVTMADLLALGAKYPDLQREFPIIALGQSWQDHDPLRRVLVGILYRSWSDPGSRDANLDDRTPRWNRPCRFAVRCLPAGQASK